MPAQLRCQCCDAAAKNSLYTAHGPEEAYMQAPAPGGHDAARASFPYTEPAWWQPECDLHTL